MRLSRAAAGLGACVALAAVLAGVPAVLIPLGHDLIPHHVPDPSTLLLHRDDTGRLFAQALLAAGWLAWASFALSAVAEAAGRVRRRRTIRLPGLSVPQRYVAALVTMIALSFAAPVAAVAAPAVVSGSAAPPATSVSPPTTGGLAVLAEAVPIAHDEVPPTSMVYAVHRGDYLGAIAARFEGSFDDYRQLAAANRIDNPHLIHPGEHIVLPADAHDHGLAPHATGRLMDDGGSATTAKPVDVTETSGNAVRTESDGTPAVPAAKGPDSAQTPVGSGGVGSGASAGVLLAGLGTLAAAVAAAELVRRRRQSLQRRLVPTTPSAARSTPADPATGSAARLMAAPRADDVVRLDAALRHLARRVADWPIERLPQITGAYIDHGAITLMLVGDAGTPPPPYTMDEGGWWRLPADAEIPNVPGDVLAPLPSLAMVGGRPGQHILLDLEFLRGLSIGGDPGAARNLLRYLVLDLCHSIWSDDLRLTLAGFDRTEADLLRSADPRRIRRVDTASAALEAYARGVRAGTGGAPNDILVIADPDPGDVPLIVDLERQLQDMPGTGMSLVVGPASEQLRYHLDVSDEGVLNIGWLGAVTPAAMLPAAMVADVVAQLARDRAAGTITPIDVARARSREARAITARRPVQVAGQHRRAKSDPSPSWATASDELMRARHARTAWS